MNKQQSQSRTNKQIGRKWWSLLIRRRHKRRGTATWRAHRQPSQKSQRWRPCLIKLAVRKIKGYQENGCVHPGNQSSTARVSSAISYSQIQTIKSFCSVQMVNCSNKKKQKLVIVKCLLLILF